MLSAILLAIGWTPTPPRSELSIDPETARDIVAAHSHGNVRLQTGLFYTRDEVDAEFEQVRHFRFDC